MSKPTVSILIASYNSAPYLRPLCESIQNQTFGDFEALVWDDGSTDNSDQVVKPYLHDPRFRLLRAPKNQGVGKSWAELLSRMQGEYWCAPGSDDVLHLDFLERRVARISTNPNAVLVHGPPVHIDAKGQHLSHLKVVLDPPEWLSGADALLSLLQHNYINQPSTLIRSSSTTRVLSLWRDDWRYAQEWHLWLLLAALEQDFLFDPVPAHQYRVHERSLTHLPSHDAVRRVEVRLVPLVGASGAARLTPCGARVWHQWRRALYALWLRRAWVLRKHPDIGRCLQIGAEAAAVSAPGQTPPGLFSQVARHAPEIFLYSLREAAARRTQTFLVSGLAQIRHELFRAR
ncbi:MAG TPA: glycosyltransferase family A protein [Verrucomicrobiae bacterium]|nr:glycosyltransferase family A protein [Verrucomicrobiae bacterium]